ncbi:MAG TPA: flagellar motor protein [Planctomycetota bacterium]|nr:flagellar motor protein [Planctomycetota bacterium]
MDTLTIAGLIVAVVGILGGQILEGGHISSIVQPTAALIVFGGTLGAVLVAFPAATVKGAMKGLKHAFLEKRESPAELAAEIVKWAKRARKDGLLALDEVAQSAPDPFVKKALRLVIDGVDGKAAREALESELSNDEERGHAEAKVFESAGGFAPTVGILGAVLGLIHVMENLSDPSKLGGGIAVAFVATVYGVGSANLIFLPLANKLKLKHGRELNVRTMALEGILSIQAGENPRVVEERLAAFLGGEGHGAAAAGGAHGAEEKG